METQRLNSNIEDNEELKKVSSIEGSRKRASISVIPS